MKFIEKHKKYLPFLGLAFILPATIMVVILAIKGIWWGSDTTILASDGFHQYVIFHQVLRNTLHGDGSLFYTFTSGLGLNFYALISYYLGSFLSPVVFFFDLQSMPDALYLLTIVKFGLIGLSSFYSISQIHKKLNYFLVLALSTSFALMSFATSQLEISVWLDVFILVPLVILGLHRLVNGQGRILYFVSLLCLFIQNYYFGYMTAIFLLFWFILQVSWNFKQRWKKVFDFILISSLSTLSSLVMLLPTVLDLRTHGETLTEIVNLQTENSWYLDLFAKNLVGSYDTTKYGAIPMIFVGLFPLILAILFFLVKSIKWPVKLSYFLFFAFLVASFYLQPLDLLWQGMHAPNMFLHRYAWVFSIFIIYTAAETLTRLKEIQWKQLALPFGILAIGFTATFILRGHYLYLSDIQFILTAEFLIAYAILLIAIVTNRISFKLFTLTSLFFAIFEISLHTQYQVDGLSDEWNFPSRDSYESSLTDIDSLVNYTNSINTDFFRSERISTQTGNDSMKYNYNGISQFSSIRNTASSGLLDKMGFRSDGTNLNLRYQNNTLIADSLFGIKYNLSTTDPLKYGFYYITSEGSMSLYENSYASQLALLTTEPYVDFELTNLTLDNQTNFLNQITGLDLQYFSSIPILSSQNTSELDERVTVNAQEGQENATATYTLTIPANSQLYVSVPNITFGNSDSENVQITVNNIATNYSLDNVFSFFSAGYYPEEQEIELILSFPGNTQVSYDIPQFYVLDLTAYDLAMSVVNEKEVSTVTDGNTVTTTYHSENDASLIFTLPYDKGWTATVNGKTAKISRAQDGLMKVDIEAGEGTVVLTFIPQGFKIGLVCFFIGIFLFIIYEWLQKKQLVKMPKLVFRKNKSK